ncbi:MAG TPA: choline/ethanolamine kinase family protein, partial [Planctomycetota bacterium]|nr:choline/ethanolamine kinase family protein [Planctomycetota bacterium]
MITIEEAIARVPRWAAAEVSAAPLGGGITNRNYRVEVNGEAFVVSLSSEDTALLGIDRRRTYQSTRAASQTGVGPELVYFHPDDGILVTRFIVGRHLAAPEVAHPEILARVVRSLHRYHAGPVLAGQFSPFRTLDAYLRVAQARGTSLPRDLGEICDRIAAIEAAARGHGIVRPCHNDLWETNLLDDGTLVRIIDWEYAGMGDVHFDLANFAIHNRFADAQDEALVRAYSGTVSGAEVALLKLLKIVAEVREAMWAVVAQNLAATAASGFDCVGYAGTH